MLKGYSRKNAYLLLKNNCEMEHFGNLKKFMLEAGRLSLEKRNAKHDQTFKGHDGKANFLVTEVDLEISRKFKEFLAENYSHLNYMIIDEETIGSLEGKVFERVKETEYQFVIDPIDGTVNYAAGIPLFGISIAVMKDGKMLEGYLYAPALDELVYTNGKNVYLEKDNKMQILPKNLKSDSRVLMGHSWFIEGQKPDVFIWEDYFSAVIYFLFIAQRRLRGAVLRANLWDIAGGMAIVKVLGMGLYDCETAEEIDEFSEKWFNSQCKVKKPYLICFKDDFEIIMNAAGKVKY